MNTSRNLLQNNVVLAFIALIISGILASSVTVADETYEYKDLNSTCKLEPEAQCTSAVRIGAKLAGIDMNHASMVTMRLDGADLQRANLSYAILQLTNFKDANMMLINLEGAHMHAANLQNANLMLANMKNVSLLDADLRGANLRGANLQGATLIQAKLDDAIWTDGRVCAEGSVGKCL